MRLSLIIKNIGWDIIYGSDEKGAFHFWKGWKTIDYQLELFDKEERE